MTLRDDIVFFVFLYQWGAWRCDVTVLTFKRSQPIKGSISGEAVHLQGGSYPSRWIWLRWMPVLELLERLCLRSDALGDGQDRPIVRSTTPMKCQRSCRTTVTRPPAEGSLSCIHLWYAMIRWVELAGHDSLAHVFLPIGCALSMLSWWYTYPWMCGMLGAHCFWLLPFVPFADPVPAL